MDEELRGMLVERIENVCHDLATKGAPIAINDAAKQVMDDLKADDNERWKQLRDHSCSPRDVLTPRFPPYRRLLGSNPV
jgi:hypothetical protein